MWGLVDVNNPDNHFEWGKDIDSFCDRLISQGNCTAYFHNLAFDGSFILDWLLSNGYKHRGGFKLRPGEFSSVIDHMGKFYSIQVKWVGGAVTMFKDSLKKLPMTVARVAESFKLGETKGELDYKAFRPVGHEPTPEELDYLKRDCVIIARAVKMTLDQGMTKLTVGADSLAQYKSLVGPGFKRLFPIFDLELDSEIRHAYRGGFTYANPVFAGKPLRRAGRVYDVNSLYPSVMYDQPMPYGHPEPFSGRYEADPGFPLYVQRLTFTAQVKPGHIPCIQVKGTTVYRATEYLSEIAEPISMMVTSVDLQLWQDHYDLNVLSWDGGFKFRCTHGLFTDYIDYWMKIKTTTEGGEKEIAKLHLNSLYGKFASSPNKTGKVPVLKDSVVSLVAGPEEFTDPIYTPVGVFITAYARDKTIRAAQDHFDIFAYADTDSLHLVTDEPPKTLDIHPTKLGAWKQEMVFADAVFLRAKTYAEQTADGEVHTHIAGLPKTIAEKLSIEDIYVGNVFHGKLLPKRVPGGIVLQEVDFSLKGV